MAEVSGVTQKSVIVTVKDGEIISKGKPISNEDASVWVKDMNKKYGKDGLTHIAVPVEPGKGTVVTTYKNNSVISHGQPINLNAAKDAARWSNSEYSKDGAHSTVINYEF